jgi:hypothetical protein
MQIPEQSNWRQNVENLKDNLLLAFIGGTAFGVFGAAEGVSIPLAAGSWRRGCHLVGTFARP